MYKKNKCNVNEAMADHFRTNIIRCSKNRIGATINRRHQLRNTKVSHFDNSLFSQENVCSFQVSETTND